MSELINKRVTNWNFRRQLLGSASALAFICGVQQAGAADDADHPTVWIELGGQLSSLSTSETKFAPDFLFDTPRPAPQTVSPLSVGHLPRRSVDWDAKVSFEPTGSDWSFSAGIRYGRSSASQRLRQQSPYPTEPIDKSVTSLGITPIFRKALEFIDTAETSTESHAIVDFQASKDVGIGMFGHQSASVLGFGVRFAQFASKSNVTFMSDPDAHPTFKYISSHFKIPAGGIYHSNRATETAARSFHGLGPTLSWKASASVFGSPERGEVVFDWGANAALLFGRQKARVHHQTTSLYHAGFYGTGNPLVTAYPPKHFDQVRSRTVTVPNVGGFAGVSFQFANAKLSAGYRADFFWGAMDGGIDTAKKENVGFYGPFASVSVGLGG
jgi:hypothetical protein